ncbi:nuclease harbi1-like protein, partial [Lasius niger]
MQLLKAREPVSVKKQLAIALYKVASCSEYRVVGNVFGVHKSTVKKYLYRVMKAINEVLAPAYINMPNQDEAKYIAMQFENISHIFQIIGCIDGTHIPITVPEEGYRDFVNRKGWTSYNVQAIVDHNGRFRNVFAKHPGSVHDAAVFKDSTLYKHSQEIIPQMEKHVNGQGIPFMIVGDPAYPLLPWLIKSYSGSVSPEEESFNVYLNSARVSVEMAFGRLKARWRMLQKKVDCNYKFVPQVIVACCVLHNFCEDNKDRFLEEWLQPVIELEVFVQPRQQIN